jgi:O-antigen ligase
MGKIAIHRQVFTYGTLALAAVIPFSTRLATWTLIVLTVDWLLAADPKGRIKNALEDPLVVCCIRVYFLELAGVLYTQHAAEGFYHAQTAASFLVIPLIYGGRNTAGGAGLSRAAMKVFCVSVLLTSLYCLALGVFHYVRTSDLSFLFYHQLVSPVSQHAVYFSIYVFISVVFLTEGLKKRIPSRKVTRILVLLGYFCFLLFLLRSKMVIGFTVLYAVFGLLRSLASHKALRPRLVFNMAVIVAAPLALFTTNPFSREVSRIKESDFAVLSHKHFSADDYFDEVQLRLLLWKFSFEILDRTHSWWAGVSAGDARYKINAMVREKGMYTGEKGTSRKGYLNYNLHDQYLETLFRSGLVGLLLLLTILYFALSGALRSRDALLASILLLFAAVFLTESVLERQIGIVPFFFFVCILGGPKAKGTLDLKIRNG